MAASAEHPTDASKLTCQGATLLGYFWDLERDSLSTEEKKQDYQLISCKMGVKTFLGPSGPQWGKLAEAEDLLPLHYKKTLT